MGLGLGALELQVSKRNKEVKVARSLFLQVSVRSGLMCWMLTEIVVFQSFEARSCE